MSECHIFPCRQIAVTERTFGCVHEHINTRPYCGSHIDGIDWDLTVGRLWCEDCRDVGCYECVLTHAEVPA